MDLPGVAELLALVRRLEEDGKRRMEERRAAMVDKALTDAQLAKFGVPTDR
jgi:hypothetical protein